MRTLSEDSKPSWVDNNNKSWQRSVNFVVNSVTIYLNLAGLTSVITLLGL